VTDIWLALVATLYTLLRMASIPPGLVCPMAEATRAARLIRQRHRPGNSQIRYSSAGFVADRKPYGPSPWFRNPARAGGNPRAVRTPAARSRESYCQDVDPHRDPHPPKYAVSPAKANLGVARLSC
jgi:hypothetical protein